MNEDNLEKLLERLKKSRVPEPPGNLQGRVWQSIREAEKEPERRWMPSFWPDWLMRPAFAVALITIAFGVGVLAGSAQASGEADPATAADDRAFLDMFHARGPGSPYDRLFYRE